MRKISKYQLFSELQHGPITSVYKAIQPELQRVVLVKQLNPDRKADAELVERFKQEGLILAKLNSPHVITIFDFGYDEGVPFLVTEFIEGNALAGLIQLKGALPWDIGLFILQQLSQGLCALHQQNIIHQDIKPENIYISNEGKVKLGDLGFSVTLDQADQQIQGTPAYLAPEVVNGSPVDFRSDLYSLGLVGYEMLTGENPFATDDLQTVLNRIVNLKPIHIHAVTPEVPAEFSKIIANLMVQDPDERIQSATELCRQLDELKASLGVRIDGDSLINFIQNPDQYQIPRLIPATEFARPHTKPNKRIRSVLIMSLFALVVIAVMLTNLLDNKPALLPDRKDTTATTLHNNQPMTDQNNIPATLGGNNRKIDSSNSTDTFDTSIFKTGSKTDTLIIPTIIPIQMDTIIITSDPKAFVFQNSDSLGITPLSMVLESYQDEIEFELRTPGLPTIKKKVTKTELTAQKIHIDLWKEVGYLDLNVIPWGEIWIDGDSIDVSPILHPIVLTHGNHRLIVRHPILKSKTETFYVAIGETLKKTIQLEKIP